MPPFVKREVNVEEVGGGATSPNSLSSTEGEEKGGKRCYKFFILSFLS